MAMLKRHGALDINLNISGTVRAADLGPLIEYTSNDSKRGPVLPRLPDDVVHSAFYLYPDRPSAEEGRDLGGTGSFVSRQYRGPHLRHLGVLFAVSNRHVVEGSGASVLRLNKRDGTPDFIELMPEDWVPHPTSDLMGVCLYGRVGYETHQIKWCEFERGLLGKDEVRKYNVGIGDDVVMIGRFIGHDGKTINRPSVRFGNISMDVAGIMNPATKRVEESWAVEMRSKPGYSGSPVCVLGSPEFTQSPSKDRRFYMMLGVEWGHINERLPLLNKAGEPFKDGQHTMQGTGMNGVVPAWRVKELIGTGDLNAQFEAAEADALKRSSGRTAVIPQAVPTKDRVPNPTHKEDFKRLLGAAVKRPKSSD